MGVAEFGEWLRGLSYEELIIEITLEKEHLKVLRSALEEAEATRVGALRAVEEERLPLWEERYRRRAERIEVLLKALPEYDRQTGRLEERLTGREKRIAELEKSIASEERRSRDLFVGVVEREISWRVAASLRRAVSGLRGWQTRDKSTLETLRGLRSWSERRIRSLRGWQTREEPLVVRLGELRSALAEAEETVSGLRGTIASEEARLGLKEEELKRKIPWRVQKARTYYAKEPGRETPEPFCEIRVWVYTYARDEEEAKRKYPESELAERLNEAEFAVNRAAGRTHIAWAKAVYYEQAYECRRVDPEEVDVPLDELQYSVIFWKLVGVKREWTYRTDEVRSWIRTGMRGLKRPEAIGQTSLKEWGTRPVPPRKFKPRRRR